MKLLKSLTRSKGYPGCVESVCRPHMTHRPCADCGSLTDASAVRIDPSTLRRRLPKVCTDCQLREQARGAQKRLVERRTKRDLPMITSPVEGSTIVHGIMPMQYAGKSRAAIRVFLESDTEVAVVPGVDSATLNASIVTLGLTDEVYAEDRDGQTVLRKAVAS